jgi:hypothetical protein
MGIIMRKYILLASFITVILTGIFIGLSASEDRMGPVIEVISSEVAYREGIEQQELLKMVTARDDRDGDVTDTVLIEDILPMLDNITAKVTYVAKDKSNNISKKEILIPYEAGYTEQEEIPPQIILSANQILLTAGTFFEPASLVSEVLDSGQSRKELISKLTIVGEYDTDTPGNYVLLLYVTNSKGIESNKEYVWIEVK